MILEPYIGKQKQWSLKTFGPGTRDEALSKHIMKELEEIKQAPGDLEEWIDVIILALEGAFRNGHSADDITQCLIMKQKKNLAREWPDWRTVDVDQPIEHVRDRFERKLIEVCSECSTASCWHGEFMCSENRSAGTELKTVAELRKMGLENESNWSDEHLNKIYGDPAPNGYQPQATREG